MYSEKYFKNHILWIRIKRVFFILICSIIGCIIGVISSSYIVDILLFDWNLKPLIIAGSTIIFFFISLLITSNSSRYVQDCLWKIETLHTLNNLSDKLDNIKGLEHSSEELSDCFAEIKKGLLTYNNIDEKESNIIKETTISDEAKNDDNLIKENEAESNSKLSIEAIEEETTKDDISDNVVVNAIEDVINNNSESTLDDHTSNNTITQELNNSEDSYTSNNIDTSMLNEQVKEEKYSDTNSNNKKSQNNSKTSSRKKNRKKNKKNKK